MPFCPQCGYEYREGVDQCPDCQRSLTQDRPEPPEKPEGDAKTRFKALPNLPGRIYAEMLQGALKKEGIPCYIQGDGFSDAYRIGGTFPLGGVQLFVPENDFDRALEIQRGMMDHI